MTDKEKLAEIESVLIRLKGTRFLLKAARAADASSDCDEREREQALDRAVDLLDEDLAELANILYLT